jgi:NADPH:quinone reductase-like Zn-dependent oxidoreductase
MKSLHLTDSNRGLTEIQTPTPAPAPGEVLVRVFAAGITPSELIWSPTTHNADGTPRAGAVPSHEFSGEIAAVGAHVTGVSIRDEIFGMNDWFAQGALAEYCITRPEWIAPKPRHLTHAEAASVPIGALTAWQGLFDRAKLQPGDRVLVHGAAGAVGIFAVQLARAAGAHVIATASAHNLEFVKELGATQVIDYRAQRFEDLVRDVDIVFDTVGGDTLQRSWSVLKSHGRMVTVAAAGETTTDDRAKLAFFIVEPKREQLIEIANLLDTGKLHTVVDTIVPLSQASAAYTGSLKRNGRGKLVALVAAA